jgi:parallel beta-helix repeat protein
MSSLVTCVFRCVFNGRLNQGKKVSVRASWRRKHMGVENLEDRLAPTVFNVNSLADILKPAAGTVTLRSAIGAANATPGSNTINLTVPGTYKITLAGSGDENNATGDFDIIPNPSSPAGSTLTIRNTSGQAVTVDGNHLDRVFDINPADATAPSNFTVLFQGFTITGGVTPKDDFNLGGGGGIEAQGNVNVTLTNMVVTGNNANDDGGGVCMWDFANASWTLTISNSTISNNSVNDAGGGVFSNGTGKILITGSVISGNFAYNQGGGIWLDSIGHDSANLTMDGTVVSNNKAFSVVGLGGGIANDGNGLVTITNSTVQNNSAGTTGGGFGDRHNFGTLTIQNSLFSGNTATANGGGIAAGGPATSITNSEIDGNTSGGSGGGVFANGTALTIQSSTLANNTASGNGGGIELDTTGTGSTMTDTTITGNTAKNADGGGIDAGTGFAGSLKLLNDTINANSAATGGGVFWAALSGSSFSLQNALIAKNSASAGADASAKSAFADLGGNLIGVSGSGSGNTGFTNSQTGTVANPLNPRLGALVNNGGPTIGAPGQTLTLNTEAPLAGSSAIGNGILSGAPATDERGSPSITNGKINVGAVSLVPAATITITGKPVQAGEGQQWNGQVAALQDPSAGANDSFAAIIDWGDKTAPTVGTVTGSNGSYSISGSHTYADEGSFPVTVSVTKNGVGQGNGTSTATVTEGDSLAGTVPTALTATAGLAFSGTVATFTDSYTASTAGNFTATITWGDNTSSTGTVSGSNGAFTVAGSHTYGSAGSFKLSVTLTENAPGSATATATSSITVSNAVSTLVPRSAIQDVLNVLPAMKTAATTSGDTNKLGEVIDKLTPSLWPSRWIDDYHLQPSLGQMVFDNVNNAVTELFGMYQDPASKVPKDQLLGILNKLAQATEQLASTAIMDAVARNGNANQIALAQQELANGMNDLSSGNFNTVIGHFKNAWLDAELS